MRVFFLCAALFAPSAVAQNYTFLSGQDVVDALNQDSMIVQGYVLGVVDALKNHPDHCFRVPYRADADQLIYAALIEELSNPPADSVQAIVDVMQNRFPCTASK